LAFEAMVGWTIRASVGATHVAQMTQRVGAI
jgi:hypothetical protein